MIYRSINVMNTHLRGLYGYPKEGYLRYVMSPLLYRVINEVPKIVFN